MQIASPTMHVAGTVRELRDHKDRVCRDILSELPEWFGIPAAVDQYERDAAHLPMFVFVTDDGMTAAFLSLKMHFPTAAEAYVLGVRRAFHRKGLGRRLFEHVEDKLKEQRVAFLTVKTLASSRQSTEYENTRKFYAAIGFLPLEEFPTLWGPGNPCLLMVKRLLPDP